MLLKFNEGKKEEMMFELDKFKILQLTKLKQKGRTEAQLRHVLDQWGIKGSAQDRYIKKVFT